MTVFGTRPEAIKFAPVVLALKADPLFEPIVAVTAQHREMLDQAVGVFGVTPDYDLNVMQAGQSLSDLTARLLVALDALVAREKPDWLLVQGDTTTVLAGGLVAYYHRVRVGHVEAGLRTGDKFQPFPEEINRRVAGVVSDLHFAPTQSNRRNLLREGVPDSAIFVTGNTVIDALSTTVRQNYSHPEIEWATGSRLLLLTAHRRENLGTPMRHMFTAIRRVVDETPDVKLIYPMHMNPSVREMAKSCFSGQERIHMIEPLDVLDFHNIMARAYFIMTDSGGIQEEAPSLGKPVLVMRDTTERPEGLEAGTLKLVGTAEQPIYEAVREMLDDSAAYRAMERAVNPYGDGHASEYIAAILEKNLN